MAYITIPEQQPETYMQHWFWRMTRHPACNAVSITGMASIAAMLLGKYLEPSENAAAWSLTVAVENACRLSILIVIAIEIAASVQKETKRNQTRLWMALPVPVIWTASHLLVLESLHQHLGTNPPAPGSTSDLLAQHAPAWFQTIDMVVPGIVAMLVSLIVREKLVRRTEEQTVGDLVNMTRPQIVAERERLQKLGPEHYQKARYAGQFLDTMNEAADALSVCRRCMQRARFNKWSRYCHRPCHPPGMQRPIEELIQASATAPIFPAPPTVRQLVDGVDATVVEAGKPVQQEGLETR